ncbi:MAG: TetR family transcriptional regulator, partial [Gammaproteobacteria bacterium]|nr:TetR family transcriptional regulator [Gammaproteobacteria bacterium]
QELDRHEQAGNPEQSLEELLEMLVRLVLAVKPRSGHDLSTFMRLLGLAFSQSQGHLRKYLGEVYGRVFKRYMTLVLRSAPELPVNVLFWRVHFMLGSAAFTLSSMKALKAMGETEYGQRAGTEEILRQMVPFFAAGMRADLLVSDELALSV